MKAKKQKLSLEDLLEEPQIDPKELHEQAAALTRRKLLLAAMHCFAEKGYNNTTIREIAKRAGMTLGAVYHHFSGKKDLLIAVTRSRQVNVIALLRKAAAKDGDFFEAIGSALRDQFRLLSSDPVVRGVTREYLGMAMLDADLKNLHIKTDLEFQDFALTELKRRYPRLSKKQRDALVRMMFASFEGLLAGLVVESPVINHVEEVLENLMNSFRLTIDKWEKQK